MSGMTRQQALDLVSRERDFQEESGRSIANRPHSPRVFASIIDDYNQEAFESDAAGEPERAMAFLRKVAALAVAAIEVHGAPERQSGGEYEP